MVNFTNNITTNFIICFQIIIKLGENAYAQNLLFILQECTSTKGKGLEGKFVYSWSGSELILLPVECEDYKQSMELLSKQEKITKKDLKIGASYKAKDRDYLIYIGKMEWFIWERVYKELPNKNGWGTYISDKWDEATRVLMPTFIDINKNEYKGIFENIKKYLADNPDVMAEVEKKVRDNFNKAFESALGEVEEDEEQETEPEE